MTAQVVDTNSMSDKDSKTASLHIVSEPDFQLDGDHIDAPLFELEPDDFKGSSLQALEQSVEQTIKAEHHFEQPELFLPLQNPEAPEQTPQLDLDGLQKPAFSINIINKDANNKERSQTVSFQHGHNLLESLEAQNVDMQYQCRSGYCGACRCKIKSGEVAYLEEPMAWLNKGEILTCCSVPKSDLVLEV